MVSWLLGAWECAIFHYMAEAITPEELQEINARYRHAAMAGEDAVDAGNGWNEAKINALVRSWQDIPRLHDAYKDRPPKGRYRVKFAIPGHPREAQPPIHELMLPDVPRVGEGVFVPWDGYEEGREFTVTHVSRWPWEAAFQAYVVLK